MFELIFIIVYFGIMMAIGPLAGRQMKKGTSSDFILAGKKAPTLLVTGGIVATMINSATLLGFTGSGFSLGISAYFSAVGYMIIITWMGFWFIPRIRRANIATIPELFGRYLGVPHRLVSMVLVMFRDVGVTAGAIIGMATIFQLLFDIPLDLALVITLGVTLFFTVTGGMWAVMVTDSIQTALLLIGTILLIPLGIAYIGGWESFTSLIPSTHVNIWNAGGSQAFAWVLMGAFTAIGYQTLVQRGLSAKSEEVAKKGFLYGGIITLVWYIVPFLIGTIAVVIFPDISPDSAYVSMAELFGEFGSIFFITLVIASCISTLSSTILTTSSNLSIDVYKELINPNATEKQVVFVTRISIFIVAIVGTLIARALPYILELLLIGGRIMGASLSPVLISLVFWKASRRAPKSTISAMVVGAMVTIVSLLIGQSVSPEEEGGVVMLWAIDPVLLGLPVTIGILVIGVLFETRNKNMNIPVADNVKSN
ncbi:sodium:solute symporter family protein [Lentibacillus jeotgali]|uniref:sodium:solute symporter family protein n=1 Tax=Lentibacillus jeotgali TaxID=558169 RepID=UPI0002627C7D|nr:sodium:solute symporter family protein [Lentibacillus jeotgali]